MEQVLYKQEEHPQNGHPAYSFVAIFGLAGHNLSPFFVTRFALLSFASRPALPALVFHFWPKATGRNRTTIGRNVCGPLKPPCVCDVGGDLGAGSHQSPMSH